MKYNIETILSNGYIYGRIKKVKNVATKTNKKSVEADLKRLDNSIEVSLEEIHKLKEKEAKLADYLFAVELMITDKVLYRRIVELRKKGMNIEDAITSSFNQIVNDMLASTSGYLKERADDIKDVSMMLINNLDAKDAADFEEKHIICSDILSPSYLIKNHTTITGVIVKNCGYTSHSAILCRVWEIPLIVTDIELGDDDMVIIDTRKKSLVVNPDSFEIENYIAEKKKYDAFSKHAIPHEDYKFSANVATLNDIQKAMDYGFDGIGLYRTELIFMNSNRPFTLIEQFDLYSKACDIVGNKPIIIRTFDVGDDKKLAYLKSDKKGINNYKNNPEIFETQVKAILKANTKGNFKIMFPMIEKKEEFCYLRDWVVKLAKAEKVSVPKIGMMLETKQALLHIEEFVDADFLSVGTNDLTKELYNINRSESTDVSSYIEDLVEKLKKVVEFCNKNDIYLSVCGELASIEDIALKFYQIGIKNLSVSPGCIGTLNGTYTKFVGEK